MKASELRELTVKELEEKIENEQSFLVKQRLSHAVSPLDNPLKIRDARKNVAKLKTVLSQKLKEENKG
jgi:large subunit ribosomal protein L29